ncbi:hypothetical protein IAT38_002572 [Cryptococcus sp. DSM 104549]
MNQSAADSVRDILSLAEGLEQWIKESEDDNKSEAVVRFKGGPDIVEALKKAERDIKNFPHITQDAGSTQIVFSRKQYDLALGVYHSLLSRSIYAVFMQLREGEWMPVTLELQEGKEALVEQVETGSSPAPHIVPHVEGRDSGAAGTGASPAPRTASLIEEDSGAAGHEAVGHTTGDIQAPSPPEARVPLAQRDRRPPRDPYPLTDTEATPDAETASAPESVRTAITPPTTPPPPPYFPPPPAAPLFLEGSMVRLYRAVESLRQIQILAKPTYPAPNTAAPAPPVASTSTVTGQAPEQPVHEVQGRPTSIKAAGTSVFGLWSCSPGKNMLPTAGVGSEVTRVPETPRPVVPPFDGIPMPGHYPPVTPSAVAEPTPHPQVDGPVIPPALVTPSLMVASSSSLPPLVAPAPSATPAPFWLPVPQTDPERVRLAAEVRALFAERANATGKVIPEAAQSKMMETLRRASEAAEANRALREAREAAELEDQRTLEARLAGDVKSWEEERWEAMREEREKRQREERAEREEAQRQAAAARVKASKLAAEKMWEEEGKRTEKEERPWVEEVARKAQETQPQSAKQAAAQELHDAQSPAQVQSTDITSSQDTLDKHSAKADPVQLDVDAQPQLHTIKQPEPDVLSENFPEEAVRAAAEAARAEAFKEKEAFILAQEKEKVERQSLEQEEQGREPEAALQAEEVVADTAEETQPEATAEGAETSSPITITLGTNGKSPITTAPPQPAPPNDVLPVVLVPAGTPSQENGGRDDIKAHGPSEDIVSDTEAVEHDTDAAPPSGSTYKGLKFYNGPLPEPEPSRDPPHSAEDAVAPSSQSKFEWPKKRRAVHPIFARANFRPTPFLARVPAKYARLGPQAEAGPRGEHQELETSSATAEEVAAEVKTVWEAERVKRSEWAKKLLAESQRRAVLRKEAAEAEATKEKELEEEKAREEAQRKEDGERIAKEIDEAQRELQRQDERWRAEQARLAEEAEERENARLAEEAAREEAEAEAAREAERVEREAREKQTEEERQQAELAAEAERRAELDAEAERQQADLTAEAERQQAELLAETERAERAARTRAEAEERERAALEAQAAREKEEAERKEREARERAEVEMERERARLSESIRRAKVDKEKEATRKEEEDRLKEKVEAAAEGPETVRPKPEQEMDLVPTPREEDRGKMGAGRRTPQPLLPHPPPPPAYHGHSNGPQPAVYMAAPQLMNAEQQRHAMEEDRARMERRGGTPMQMMHAPPPFTHPPQRHHQAMYHPYLPPHPQQLHQPHQIYPPHPQHAVHQPGPHLNNGPHMNGQQHPHPGNMPYPIGPQPPPRAVHAGHNIYQAHPGQQPQQLLHQHQQQPPFPQYNGPQNYPPQPHGVQYGPSHPPAGDNIWARPGHDDYDGSAGRREMKHPDLATSQSLPTMLDPEQAARLRAAGTPFMVDGKPRMMPPRFQVPQQHPPPPPEHVEVTPAKTPTPRMEQNRLRPPLYEFKPGASPGAVTPVSREPSPAAKAPSPATKEPTPEPSPAVTPQEPPQREIPLRQFQIPKPRVREPVELAVTPNEKHPVPGMLPPVIGMLPQHPARAPPAFQPRIDLRRVDARPPNGEEKTLEEIENARAFMEELMANVGKNHGDVKIRKERRR